MLIKAYDAIQTFYIIQSKNQLTCKVKTKRTTYQNMQKNCINNMTKH